jgi:hypothetical protein
MNDVLAYKEYLGIKYMNFNNSTLQLFSIFYLNNILEKH